MFARVGVTIKQTQRVGCERGCYKTNTNGECASVQAWLQQTNTEIGHARLVATDEYSEDRECVGVGVTNKDSECVGV